MSEKHKKLPLSAAPKDYPKTWQKHSPPYHSEESEPLQQLDMFNPPIDTTTPQHQTPLPFSVPETPPLQRPTFESTDSQQVLTDQIITILIASKQLEDNQRVNVANIEHVDDVRIKKDHIYKHGKATHSRLKVNFKHPDNEGLTFLTAYLPLDKKLKPLLKALPSPPPRQLDTPPVATPHPQSVPPCQPHTIFDASEKRLPQQKVSYDTTHYSSRSYPTHQQAQPSHHITIEPSQDPFPPFFTQEERNEDIQERASRVDEYNHTQVLKFFALLLPHNGMIFSSVHVARQNDRRLTIEGYSHHPDNGSYSDFSINLDLDHPGFITQSQVYSQA